LTSVKKIFIYPDYLKIWFPILQAWLKDNFESSQIFNIDRTNWGCINLLMISLIWDKRAYNILGTFTQKGTSDFEKQTTAISKVLPA